LLSDGEQCTTNAAPGGGGLNEALRKMRASCALTSASLSSARANSSHVIVVINIYDF